MARVSMQTIEPRAMPAVSTAAEQTTTTDGTSSDALELNTTFCRVTDDIEG
jgi:hypothetical protein